MKSVVSFQPSYWQPRVTFSNLHHGGLRQLKVIMVTTWQYYLDVLLVLGLVFRLSLLGDMNVHSTYAKVRIFCTENGQK